jgi:COP9 signalosome complex subunit 7
MYYDLLRLFAYGTVKIYHEHKEKFPELSVLQVQKLRHLTIITLATLEKVLYNRYS